MNYNLEGMTKAEGHSYVTAKLNGAGCTQTVFEENALEAILNAANGTPRMINKLFRIYITVIPHKNPKTSSATVSHLIALSLQSDTPVRIHSEYIPAVLHPVLFSCAAD